MYRAFSLVCATVNDKNCVFILAGSLRLGETAFLPHLA